MILWIVSQSLTQFIRDLELLRLSIQFFSLMIFNLAKSCLFVHTHTTRLIQKSQAKVEQWVNYIVS